MMFMSQFPYSEVVGLVLRDGSSNNGPKTNQAMNSHKKFRD